MAPLTFIAWKKYYGSQWGPSAVWLCPYYRYEESRRMQEDFAFDFTSRI